MVYQLCTGCFEHQGERAARSAGTNLLGGGVVVALKALTFPVMVRFHAAQPFSIRVGALQWEVLPVQMR